ncbi:filamentous hemagglutinin N-terminal domain-containing protein [Chromobacterium haemolyticum]|uniref:Filamentous hemagglutinin N-terminal domain-containing protein n=1 Tax=Chromobacterium fluminis TaxID=3044269 RepID=A0ABX0L602_9NEIS|nr:hemagglutinin repeat-containing protein [Chromobacterium haemolyticum]NHR06436.1 filamentous hemagglutinin N-terminal domain-containing protein [Chromobacterium haemolyticum]
MNKTLYRIIFNQARGQLMAVQETASGQGKGSGRGQNAAGARFAAVRGFGFKLCALWVGVSLGSVALAADIAADPGAAAGKRPTVIQANNGLPVVQIAAPTAAGVSHNQYQQFNVGPKGAVLNNSAQVVNTQLAGYVGGNPNLAGGSARIILNEVTHANPSQLNGYLEVAGQRAQVVVANPWGISCSGCGFINTQQAMLSTGTPQLNAQGALTGFQVNGGAVNISGAGLNAGNVDKFAIISRALQVNADLHAKQLELVLGRNQVDADTLQARPLAADGSAAPAFALDVAQLGGMYANAIRLVGTEAGVGVKQQGEMAARAGDLQLSSAGDLVLKGKTFSQQDIKLNSGGKLEHSGQTRSQGALQVTAADAAQLEGSLTAGGGLGLDAAAVAGKGSVAAGAQADGKLGEAGALTLRSRASLDFHGELLAGGDVNIQAGSAQLQGAVVGASHGDLRVTVDGELNASQAKLGAKNLARLQTGEDIKLQQGALSAGQLELQARALDNRGGLIAQSGAAASSVRLQGVLDNRGGVISSQGKTLSVDAEAIDNRHGEISHAGADTLRVSADKIDNREQGKLHSDAKAEIKTAELDNAQGRLTALQGLELNASRVLRNDGLLGSDGQFKLTAGQLENGAGLIQAGRDLQLTAASVSNADKGQIMALGKDAASSLEISGQLNNQGKIAGNAGLSIKAADIDNHGGTLQSADELKLEKQARLNNDGGHIVAKDLNLKADTLSNQGGEVFAQQALDAKLQQLNNAKGSLIGSQSLSLSASEVLRNNGLLGSDGQFKLTAGQLENGAGLIQAGKDLQLTAASVNNADKGQILALGKDTASSLEISGQLNNQGKIAGNAQLDIKAADIDNHGGTLQSAAQLNLSKQAGLNNDGGHIVAKDLNLKAGTLSNQGGEVFAQQALNAKLQQLNNAKGSLIGSQSLSLSASDVLRNDGLLGSDGQFTLTAGQLENGAGLIQAGKDLQLTAASVSNADKGQILALGKDAASSLEISGLLNNQGKIAGNAGLDIKAADIDNHGGTLQSAGELKLEKQASLNNDGGHIVAKDLTLKADTFSNQGGEVFAQQALDAKLLKLNNAKGSLIGSQKLNLTASASLHNDGLLGSDGQFKLTTGQLENGAGLIQAGKDLQLTAASVDNADKGQILALGKDAASSLGISGQLNNQGKIAGNAGLDIKAADIDNHGGTLQSAGELKLEKQSSLKNDGGHIVAKDLNLKADTLSNQGGEVFAQQQLDAQLGQLNNAKGSLIGSQGFTLSASEVLRNNGLLGSDGQFTLTAGQLENGGGLIQAGKDLQLNAASVSNADKGQILALGKDAASSLEISGQLNNQGKIAGNAGLDIKAADIDNHGGTLQSAGELKLEKQASLNNDGGHIVAKDLNLKADRLSNKGGEIRHLGQTMAQWQVRQRLDNQQGTLFSNGGLTLAAHSLNNQQGSLSSLGAQSLQLAQGLDNQGGALVSGQGLQLQLGAALSNQGGTVQAESLQMHAAGLGNQGGSIKVLGSGDGKVNISGTLDNSAQGLLAGNGGLEVNAAALDNRQGVLQSAAKLGVQVAQVAQNQGGKIQAGQLQLKAAELNNQQGLLSQAGDGVAKLELSGQLDNSLQGKVLSNGQLQVTAAGLLNAGGTLSSQGDLQLSASGALDNRQGALGSNDALKLDSASVDNAGGLIQAGRTLALDSGSLLNQGGKLLALGSGDSRVTLSGQLNNGGQIAGNGDWRIKAQGLDNAGGSLLSVGSLGIDTVSLGNSGSFLAGKDLSLTLASDFIHAAGSKLQANGKLSISSGGNLINSGQLQAGGDLVLNGVSWTNSGEVNAGGKLSAALSQALSNSGKLSAGSLQLNAASVLNTYSITGGDISIQAASLDNGGNQGLIASAGNMALDIGQTLNNHDGSWLYSQGDMRIGKAGAAVGQVINHVATLQSDGNMFIDAGRVSNESSVLLVTQKSEQYIESRKLLPGYKGVENFNFSSGVNVVEWMTTELESNSCITRGTSCHDVTVYNYLKREVVSDDPVNKVLTVKTIGASSRREPTANPRWGGLFGASTLKEEKIYYFDKRDGVYSAIIGFDPKLHLLPNDLKGIAEKAVAGRDFVAESGEVERVSTVSVVTDHVEGELLPSRVFVGKDFFVNSMAVQNKYSTIAIGGGAFVKGGEIDNVGQNVEKTVKVDSVGRFTNIFSRNPVPECGVIWGRSICQSRPLPSKTTTEKLGSVGASVSSGQKLTLQAPTISNGKASQLDISLTTGDSQSKVTAVNTTAGKALAQADGDMASAGKNLGGKPLDAVASAQTLAGQLTGAQAAADLQKSAVGGQAGAQWDGAKAAVLPQQVLLESAGTKAANPVAGGYSLPNNGLFQTRPAPAQPYLVETDPRFTQYGNFISSDYLLKQLGYDPSRVEKRLGDGFYEQQLVSRAVTELTGKRFIGGNANATQQYQQLMSQGAEYAKKFQLTPGVALSAEQMSRLTADMVWLVKQNVDGHDVLVPVVYLAKAQEQSLRGQGAVLAGRHMELLADGSLINSGTLKADNSLLAQAGDIRIEGGKVLAGGDLGLGARHDLLVSDDKQHSQVGSVIQAGSLQLQAGNDLKLQAVQLQVSGDAQLQAGHDLDITSRENRYSYGANTGRSQYSYQQVDHVGSALQVGGSLGFNAGHDLTLSGGEVKAGGKLLAVAGNELTLQSTLDSKQGQGSWNGWGWGAYSTLDQIRHATQLQAGGDMLLQAGGNLALNGSQAQAGGGLLALAGKQLTLQSEANTKQDIGSSGGSSHNWRTDSLTVAALSGKNDLQLQAGDDALLNGASLLSGGKLGLSAGNDIKLGAVATENRSDNSWGQDVHNNYDLTQHGSALRGETGLTLLAGRDIAAQAASLSSDGEAALAARRDISLGSVANLHSDYSKTVRSSGGFMRKKTTVDISSHQSATQVGSNLSADKVTVSAGRDLGIQASQVASTDTASLQAGNDIRVQAGTNASQSFQYHYEKKSGFFGTGWGGFMIGSKELSDAMNAQGTTQSQSKSLVGSLKGDLTVQAGGKLLVQGSSLSALNGDVAVGANSVLVQDGRDVMVVDRSHVEKQSGFSMKTVNTLKDTFDNLKEIVSTRRGFGLVKGVGAEISAFALSSSSQDMSYSSLEQGYQQHNRTVSSVGSAILAGGDIKLLASGTPAQLPGNGDLSVVGSSLQAGGKVDLFAKGNVDILAGVNDRQDGFSSYSHASRASLYTPQLGDLVRAFEGVPNHSGTSLTPYNQARQDGNGRQNDQQLNPSQVRGEQIRVVSLGGDVNVVGSTLQGVKDVTVAADQGSVNVLAATAHYQFSQDNRGFTLGNVGGGNHSATVGVQHTEDKALGSGSQQSVALSQITSLQGNVALSAADAVRVAGAQLAAGQDLTLSGKSVQIRPGVDQDSRVETHHMDQWGVTAGVSSPVLSALDAVDKMGQVAAGGQNADSRTRALATGTAALAAYNGYKAAQAAADGQLVSASVTIGANRSDSKQETQSLTHTGTRLEAGRDLLIQASGGGKDSNIDIVGSQLQAGRNATLKADNQVALQSAQDSSSLRGENSGSGWGVGIGASFGQGGFSVGVTANANHSFGGESGDTVDQRHATVNAGNTLTLQSGGDAVLKGAEARGREIVANVGGNLDIQSQQDLHQYHSSGKSLGGSVTVGLGFSASGSYSQQKMDNDYASVQNQSGLKAGDGGFQVAVKGNTHLTGGVIASSDKAVADGKNSLSTGTLTVGDVQNHANYSGSSISLGGSGSMKGGEVKFGSMDAVGGQDIHAQQFGNGGGANAFGAIAAHESADSVTRAGVSGGKLSIADSAGQQALTGQTAEQAAAALNRDVSSDRDGANSLQDKFDKQQLQTTFAVVQALTEQISVFTAAKAAEAKAAKEEADKAQKNPAKSDAEKERLQATAANAAKWAPGGAYSQILIAVTAGIGGNVANGLGGMEQNAGIAYLQGLGAQQVKALVDGMEGGAKTPEGETVRAVLHAALACGGASASGQSCGAGAAGAAAAVALNNALDTLQKTSPDTMTAEQKLQRESLVSGLLAGLSAVTGGADTAATTVNAAKTELENNQFGDSTVDQYLYAGKSRGIRALVEKANQKGSSQGLVLAAAFLTAQGTPAAIAAARACMSNPLCLNELAISLGEVAAGDALPTGLGVGGAALIKSVEKYRALEAAGEKAEAAIVLEGAVKKIAGLRAAGDTAKLSQLTAHANQQLLDAVNAIPSKNQASKIATMIAAFDPETGKVAIGYSSGFRKAEDLSPLTVKYVEERLGVTIGEFTNLCSNRVGACAEISAADKLIRQGVRPESIEFTQAVRPLTILKNGGVMEEKAIISTCGNCQRTWPKGERAQ